MSRDGESIQGGTVDAMRDRDDESAVERELKIPTADLGSVRRRLIKAQAEVVCERGPEENWVFDRDDELRRSGRLLRLRRDGRGARWTYKGPATFDHGVKVREEREVELSSDAANVSAAVALLERLGYRMVRRYQKVREEWRLGDVRVALDETPIGTFVEVEAEGGGSEAALAAARTCGLDPAAAESQTYLELYDTYRLRNPSAPEDMVFETD